MEPTQAIDLKTLVVIMGLASPVITISVMIGVMKYIVGDLRKTVYGNGKPGLVKEFSDIQGEIGVMKKQCEMTHRSTMSESAAERKLDRAAEVAVEKISHAAEIASARVLADAHTHDNV